MFEIPYAYGRIYIASENFESQDKKINYLSEKVSALEQERTCSQK